MHPSVHRLSRGLAAVLVLVASLAVGVVSFVLTGSTGASADVPQRRVAPAEATGTAAPSPAPSTTIAAVIGEAIVLERGGEVTTR